MDVLIRPTSGRCWKLREQVRAAQPTREGSWNSAEDLIGLLEDSIPRHVLSISSLTKFLELVGSSGGEDPCQLLDMHHRVSYEAFTRLQLSLPVQVYRTLIPQTDNIF